MNRCATVGHALIVTIAVLTGAVACGTSETGSKSGTHVQGTVDGVDPANYYCTVTVNQLSSSGQPLAAVPHGVDGHGKWSATLPAKSRYTFAATCSKNTAHHDSDEMRGTTKAIDISSQKHVTIHVTAT